MDEIKYLQIPPKKTLLQRLREGLKEANISQTQLATFLEDCQGNISKKLRGKKSFSLEQVSDITSFILERIASIPQKPISDIYVSSEKVVAAYSNDTVLMAIRKMDQGNFTQIPVIDKETGKCMGIVTDFTILKRMLSPQKNSKENWLSEFKKMTIKQAKIVDETPTYPLKTPIAEIAQALMFHYAILILETRDKIGIVTRADFLKALQN